jgi:nicotinamidase/pyrazinamidase
MLDGPLVFVDVDTQRDFLEPSGVLFVAGSETIVPNLARLTAFARTHSIPVLATACAHSPGDEELNEFPLHCMTGTRGQQRVEATAWPGGFVLGSDDTFAGPLPAHLTIEKRRYDVFSHPEADRIVRDYARSNPTFVVYGVATDYCVRACVEGLLDRGLRVAVVVDAIRPIDRAAEPEVLGEFLERGVLLTLTEVVCAEPAPAETPARVPPAANLA